MSRFLLVPFCAVVLSACQNTPTAADARDALTQACVTTVAAEAIVAGRQLPPQVEKLCSNPELQAKLIAIVKEAEELKNAVHDVLPHRDAGVVQ